MPQISTDTSIAAGATFNPLSGSQFEYIPYNAQLEIAILGSATGLVATISSGSDILMEEGPVSIGTIHVAPKYPDDFHLTDVAAAGDRIKVGIRNTTGGALNAFVVVRITPLLG